jgi:hypothetical protein
MCTSMNLDTEIIYCLRYDFHRWSWLGAYQHQTLLFMASLTLPGK